MSKIFEDAINAVPLHAQERAAMSLDVVDRIQAILEMKGMSHKDLAEALGKSESEISKWMRGTHNFTFETIAKINVALGTKLLDIPKGRRRKQVIGATHHLRTTVIAVDAIRPLKKEEEVSPRFFFSPGKSGLMLSLPVIFKKN